MGPQRTGGRTPDLKSMAAHCAQSLVKGLPDVCEHVRAYISAES